MSGDMRKDSAGTDTLVTPQWKRWLPYLAPVLLVVVAINQIFLAHRTDLNPWKGGGFGMFSAIERRDVRVIAVTPDGDKRARLPRMGYALAKARHYPSDENLTNLAERLAQILGPRFPRAEAFRVEIWRGDFNPETSTLTWLKWRELTYEFADLDF